LVAFVPAATSQVTLEIKPQEITTFKTRHIHKSSNTIQIAGQEGGWKHSLVGMNESVTGVRAADGTLSAKTIAKTLTFKIEAPGFEEEFDSADSDRKAANEVFEPWFEVFRIMLKHPVIAVFNKDGSSKTAGFPDEAGRDLPEPFKKFLKPGLLTSNLKQQHEMLSDKAVSKGDTWTRSQEVRLGPYER
jgi:hypothetical protein